MAKLARIAPGVALACPGCQARLPNVPLEAIAAGEGYECPHCGQSLNISASLLARLIAQRDAALDSDFEDEDPPAGLTHWLLSLRAGFRRMLGLDR